jgi:hypothetical protein
MSDSAQILVAIDCPAEEAVEHGEAVLQWLVEHGIVQPELSDCVLGGDGRGYAPGPEMSAAVDSDADGTRQLRTNGVAIVVGRTIVDGGENEIELRCRRCRTSFEPTDGWFEAMDSWARGEDEARYACPSCGFEEPIREWNGPWPWGFGHLGLEFWNWPPLKGVFVDQLTSLLPGRLRLVHQHVESGVPGAADEATWPLYRLTRF